MFEKFKKHIADRFPFLEGKKLLIAVSGGVDSVVLTHLLQKLKFNISIAHCNFQLREKESDLDEAFVLNILQKSYNQTFTKKINTKEFAKKNKLSTQVAARNLRYKWFKELIKEHKFDFILTAHHADDNLETFLINLTRGSGIDGFTGIPTINLKTVRPLLIFSRQEILDYANKNNIEWREDKSNNEIKYIRNKIRHQIVPGLKEINPNLLETFSKTIENLQQSRDIIDDRVKEIKKEIVTIENNIIKVNVIKLKKLSNPKAYLFELLKSYHFTEWKDVKNLISAQSGKQIFSATHRLVKHRNELLLSIRGNNSFCETSFIINKNTSKITNPINLEFKTIKEFLKGDRQTICVDKDLLKFPLIVRKWKNGDYFYPSGMKGKKKLSKFFKDEKLSLLDKENIWLLCSSENEIIWVINKRQDNRFLVNNTSKNIIKISTINKVN